MPDPSPLYEALTEREYDMLRLLAEGLSNREIAETLFLAVGTVKVYNNQLFSKLGVSNRTQAVVRAQELGLLTGDVESQHVASAPVGSSLPTQSTPFIGRQRELVDLANLLIDLDLRLLSLLAPGGMGKTRLALAAAEGQRQHFADGVLFVPLAPLNSPDAIVTAIADRAGFTFYGEDSPRQQLLGYFRERHMLLVLDNFEHLLDGASLVADILQHAPEITVLVTSRERLNLSGETIYTLTGLPVPELDMPDDALAADAVQLFLQSAQRVRPDFALQAGDLPSLARLCHLTGGMPLALVLAASWLDMLPLDQVAAELQKSIDILETQMRDVPQRHRSVRASFDYTWINLKDEERDLFMKLSIFRGGFTVVAAQAVAGANLRQLRTLVDKSLVQTLPAGRYDVHELLRQYGEEQLEATGEAQAIATAHRSYFATFMQEHEDDIKGRRQLAGLNEIETDFDNVRVAWERAIEHADYDALDRMMEGLVLFCEMRTRYQEGEDLFKHAIESITPGSNDNLRLTLNRLQICWVRVWLAQERYPIPESIQEQLVSSLEVARQQGKQASVAWCLWAQGEFERVSPYPPEAALVFYEQAKAHFSDLGNAYAVGRALRGMTFCYYTLGPSYQQQFKLCHQQLLDLTRDIGDRTGMAHAIIFGGYMAERQGNLAEAVSLSQEAAAIWREMGDRKSLGVAVLVQAFSDLFGGQWASARQAAEQVVTIGSDTNYAWLTGVGLSILGFMAVVGGDYAAGQRLGHEARTHTASSWAHDNTSERTLCLAAFGLGDYEQARQRLQTAFQILTQQFQRSEAIHWVAIAGLILAHDGKKTRAVEVLGLVRSQSEEITGWMVHWRLLTDLERDLEADLGPEAYTAAHERGKTLDLEAVVEELLAEFADAAGT